MITFEKNSPTIVDETEDLKVSVSPFICLEDNRKRYLNYFETVKKADSEYFVFESEVSVLKIFLFTENESSALKVELDIKQSYDCESLNSRCAMGIDFYAENKNCAVLSSTLGCYWTRPYVTEDLSKIKDHTQALLWKNKKGIYFYLSSICDSKYKSDIAGGRSEDLNGYRNKTSNDCLTVYLYSNKSGFNKCNSIVLVMTSGENPYVLPEKTVEYGCKLTNRAFRPRMKRRYNDVFNYLGWCSWDAFQLEINRDGLLEKAQEFKDKNIPIRWLLIDDMWAEVKNNINPGTNKNLPLYSFEADPRRFPKGLKETITEIKNSYDLKIGMWHPTTGYWGGVDPNGPIAKDLSDALTYTTDGRLIPDFSNKNGCRFFDAFHTFLEDCGADFVKVDNQSTLPHFWRQLMSIGEVASELHKSLEASVSLHFDGAVINCMGMATENFWNRPISSVSRCSNDFKPENREWFKEHLLQCSTNSFTQGCLYTTDWDMWWTDDSQAEKNSVLRAVSGGPVYISDKLGRSNKKLIEPLVFSDGYILRCDIPATPTKDSLFFKDGAYKVFNRVGDIGVVAAFNLSADETSVSVSVSTEDLPFFEDESAIIWDYREKKAFRLKDKEKKTLTLTDYDDYKLFLIYPQKEITPLGLVNKYIAPAEMEIIKPNIIRLREGGRFGFVAEYNMDYILCNNKKVKVNIADGYYYADCGKTGESVLIEIREEEN